LPNKKIPLTLRQSQKVLALTLAFNEAAGKSDAAAIAALFTEDGVFVTDTGPVYGRQAIQKRYEDVFQQLQIKKHVGIPDQGCPHTIGTAGNEVWENGEWSETIQFLRRPLRVPNYEDLSI
jgi:hypothetical protein